MTNEFNEQQPIPNLEIPQISPEELDEMDFSYDGYQVVRGEFFAHLFEPSITFNNNRVYLNMACIRKFPNIDYVQILVNSEDKKLAVRPCNGEEKDSFLWCTAKRKPKQISCRVFWGKIASLLDWNESYRYKLLGKLIKSNDEFGVLICGSGIGISIAANRFSHIRCALGHNATIARLSREHNDANVLAWVSVLSEQG